MKIETADWRNPFLVAAFGGWGDAASVATTSATFLMQNRAGQRGSASSTPRSTSS